MPAAHRLSRSRPVQAQRLPLTLALAAHRLSRPPAPARHRQPAALHLPVTLRNPTQRPRIQPCRGVRRLATAPQPPRAQLIPARPAAPPAALPRLAAPAQLLPPVPPIRV